MVLIIMDKDTLKKWTKSHSACRGKRPNDKNTKRSSMSSAKIVFAFHAFHQLVVEKYQTTKIQSVPLCRAQKLCLLSCFSWKKGVKL